jgi:hypothetical protein
MAGISFEWDLSKDRANRRRHGISFEEAQTVIFDERALFMADPDHSDEEERFLLLGLGAQLRVLIVCHCYREDDQVIRLISARKATRSELHQYWNR